MSDSAKYFHDRPILVFFVINVFLTLAIIVSVAIRLFSGPGTNFISQYRENLGLDAFSSGSIIDILAFIGFVFIVLGFNFVVSKKIHRINRYAAIMVVAVTSLTLVFALVVSSSLLALR